MQMIAPPRADRGQRRVVVPRSAGRSVQSHRKSQRRRTRILVVSGGMVIVSAVAALSAGGGWWELHLLCDFSFALYVVMLLEAKKRRAERLQKVRPLATRSKPSRPAPARLNVSGARR